MLFLSIDFWRHPHTLIRIILFHDEQRDIPNLEFSPIHVCIGFSQIAFPIIVRPYRFRSRGTTGSSILDHDFGHLCRGKRIQMSGHSDFGIFNNLWASSILGRSRYCVCRLSIATRQSGDDIHDFGCCHLRCWRSMFSEYCVRARNVFYKITTEYNSTFVFLVLCLQFSIFRWHMSINDAKWTVAPDVLASVNHFFLLTVVSLHPENFSIFPHSLSTAAFCCKNFRSLRHQNKFVNQIVVL